MRSEDALREDFRESPPRTPLKALNLSECMGRLIFRDDSTGGERTELIGGQKCANCRQRKNGAFYVTAVWKVHTLSQIELSLLSQLQFRVYTL